MAAELIPRPERTPPPSAHADGVGVKHLIDDERGKHPQAQILPPRFHADVGKSLPIK
ncbi:MAG: hypothetical protein ACKV2Q_26385 [Planctomycetaceae bacterium]